MPQFSLEDGTSELNSEGWLEAIWKSMMGKGWNNFQGRKHSIYQETVVAGAAGCKGPRANVIQEAERWVGTVPDISKYFSLYPKSQGKASLLSRGCDKENIKCMFWKDCCGCTCEEWIVGVEKLDVGTRVKPRLMLGGGGLGDGGEYGISGLVFVLPVRDRSDHIIWPEEGIVSLEQEPGDLKCYTAH